MKQTLEEAAKEAIHAHYNCNGKYPCGERNYCEHCNGHNTAHDCCECGADEFKEGFIACAEWHAKQSIEVLSSILENWVHGGDADCIIAEFEEKLRENRKTE